ncbi:hypothetical protein QE152_g7131 [Popillia japonica]|uniref:Uncharacterized protein n=1 Tax=Popillia japonica TaxID=7064 RepID=A0AAW1MFN3_POPJA
MRTDAKTVKALLKSVKPDITDVLWYPGERSMRTDAKTVKALLKSVKPDITDVHSASIMRLSAAATKKPRPSRLPTFLKTR